MKKLVINDNDMQNAIETLEKENKELKKQLEELKNGYKIKLRRLLAEGMEPDLEDFYLAEIEGKANDYDKLLNQQKEFIKYLERRIEYVTATYQCHRLDVDGMILFNLKNVLEKYKEIVGADK